MYTFAVCNCGATISTLIAITPTLIVRGYPYPYRDYPYPYRDYPYPYRARLSVPLFRLRYGALAVDCGTAAALRYGCDGDIGSALPMCIYAYRTYP
jgi:hypothetical protein